MNPAPPSTVRPGPALSFSVLGFPVRARADFFIVSALFGSSGGRSLQDVFAWVVIVFVSVLVHELGHALIGRVFGCRSTIELHTMGGTTTLTPADGVSRVGHPSWFGDLAISVAGPTFGLLLGGVVWLASRGIPTLPLEHEETARWLVRQLLWVNVGWSLVNLVPILPYDGGQASRAVLRRLSPTEGDRVAHVLTVALGVAVIVVAVVLRNRWGGSVWVGYLAARGVFGSWAELQKSRGARSLSTAWAAWDARDFTASRAGAERTVEHARDSRVRGAALELVVFSCLALRDAAAAKKAFDAYPEELEPSALLRAVVALDREDGTATALLRQVDEAVATRVLLPLITAWRETPWQERVTAWLDASTVSALPRELQERLLALQVSPLPSPR